MRKTSHMQSQEPVLESLLSELRFRQVIKRVKSNYIVGDLGCGYHGNLLKRISTKIKTGVGYDISVARTNIPKNIELKKANLNKKFSSKKNYFDLITALAVLEHVENPENFIKQIKTMLKKGGFLVITTPHKKGKSILEFIAFRLGLVSHEEIMDHKNYFDEKTLKNLFKKVNLKTIKVSTFEFGMNLLGVAQKV